MVDVAAVVGLKYVDSGQPGAAVGAQPAAALAAIAICLQRVGDVIRLVVGVDDAAATL